MHFPQSAPPPAMAIEVVAAFDRVWGKINSDSFELPSNSVLAAVAPELEALGFRVESGKKHTEKIRVPVLYGMNGAIDKSFDADAFHQRCGFVVEVEAGRGVVNNQFLKDLFQACMMDGAKYLCIAVRNQYKGQKDFLTVVAFMQTLYASNRMSLPLEGLVIVGY